MKRYVTLGVPIKEVPRNKGSEDDRVEVFGILARILAGKDEDVQE